MRWPSFLTWLYDKAASILGGDGRKARLPSHPIVLPGDDGIWPPIYDATELTAAIESMARSNTREKYFYDHGTIAGFFQGDIVECEFELPHIDESGAAAAEEPVDHWMVLGNTCDIDRELEDVEWTQIIPVWDLGEKTGLPREALRSLQEYRTFRQFYLPPWSTDLEGHHFVADFLRPVTIHKTALSRTQVVARLSYPGWILFHACVVRFVARGDGRHT